DLVTEFHLTRRMRYNLCRIWPDIARTIISACPHDMMHILQRNVMGPLHEAHSRVSFRRSSRGYTARTAMSETERKTPVTPVDVPIRSWPEFVAYFAEEQRHGWIYRGLPDARFLPIPKIWRDLAEPYKIGDSRWTYQENIGITYFKSVAPLYVSNLPDDDDLIGWLALMQHYGAPTGLTDWTMS